MINIQNNIFTTYYYLNSPCNEINISNRSVFYIESVLSKIVFVYIKLVLNSKKWNKGFITFYYFKVNQLVSNNQNHTKLLINHYKLLIIYQNILSIHIRIIFTKRQIKMIELKQRGVAYLNSVFDCLRTWFSNVQPFESSNSSTIHLSSVHHNKGISQSQTCLNQASI